MADESSESRLPGHFPANTALSRPFFASSRGGRVGEINLIYCQSNLTG